MRRRELIAGLGSTLAWPVAARAQQPPMPVVGVLNSGDGFIAPLLQGLRDAGYVEGQNVRIEWRPAKGAYEQLPDLAGELTALRVNVIIAQGTPAALAAKTATNKATPAIPVVFALGSDPVIEGLVESFNRPGKNVTGVTSVGSQIASKRVDIAREFLRADFAIAIMINPLNPANESESRDAETAARSIGRHVEVITARSESEIESAFASMKERRVGVVILANDTFFFSQMQRFATLASQHSVPTIGTRRDFVAEGGLLSYGTNISEVNRQAAIVAGKILKGARPADLPVQRPTKFELTLNLRAAKKLGIAFSPTLLALADEVIE